MRIYHPGDGNPYAGPPADAAVIRLHEGACSHLGLRRRRNEDAFLTAPDHGLYAVADGMGGHPGGDVASRMAIDTLARALTGRHGGSADAAAGLLTAAFADANGALLEYALARPDHHGLGTTLTALLVRDRRAVVCHVGDSRLYRIRDGECRQLTTDHTWVEREIAEGRLTREGARHHPHSAVLLRVLGGADSNVDLHDFELFAGDRIMLCTDGVSNALAPADLAAIARQAIAPADVARQLCDAADARGGHDNSTAIIVDVS